MVRLFERIKKFIFSVLGLPYVWIDMTYVTGAFVFETDFNQAMIAKLTAMGYDTSDPQQAVNDYVADCFGQPVTDDDDGSDDAPWKEYT